MPIGAEDRQSGHLHGFVLRLEGIGCYRERHIAILWVIVAGSLSTLRLKVACEVDVTCGVKRQAVWKRRLCPAEEGAVKQVGAGGIQLGDKQRRAA